MPDRKPTALLALALILVTSGLLTTSGCMTVELLPLGYPPAAPQFSASAAAGAVPNGTQELSRSQGPLLVVFTYGFGAPSWGAGNGLRAVADSIRSLYPSNIVITRGCDDSDAIQEKIERHQGPVALIGHSFGGSRSVELASKSRRAIDHLILLDPVPRYDCVFPHPGKYFEVPANVRNSICYYRPSENWGPPSYPLVNPRTATDNRLRSLGHSEFCRSNEVHKAILNVCAIEQARTVVQSPVLAGLPLQ